MYQMHQGDYESVYRFVFAGFIVKKSMLNISKASGCLLIMVDRIALACFIVNKSILNVSKASGYFLISLLICIKPVLLSINLC